MVAAAAGLFLERGYEATSIDDHVAVTGLHRGRLYKAFGSKRGMFIAALHRLVHDRARPRPLRSQQGGVRRSTMAAGSVCRAKPAEGSSRARCAVSSSAASLRPSGPTAARPSRMNSARTVVAVTRVRVP
jgi:TetR/AcrR family transcriptional repressor of nem operon